MLPVIEELANVYTGKLKVVRLNVDDNSAIASTYRVSIVPTVMFFKGTQKLHEIICAVSKPDLERSIQSLS
jgi:thioredoxin 1